ncbi:hypothetical protein EVC24_004 [Rhizobium phage RHph_I4]|nr:hypothetical protein EVC24_004 [Rhizobium phage RHph_I4]
MSDAQEEKWWLKKYITNEERALIRADPVKRADRRDAAVVWRLEENEKKLTTARRKKITRWFDQWVRGEAMREMMHGDYEAYSLKAWLRKQFVEAVRGAFDRGQSMERNLENVIRAEVGKVLTGYGYTKDKAGRKKFEGYIKKIVEDEVKKQVMASLNIDINVKGRVFSPATGQRRVDLGTPDEAWED